MCPDLAMDLKEYSQNSNMSSIPLLKSDTVDFTWIFEMIISVADPEGTQQASALSKFWSTMCFYIGFQSYIRMLQNKAHS